ncbi:MAG: hypothetical protein SPE01_06955, partial [Candidatus Spyradocola sp.]|nr:hypothetical protein [Candidatus Spyradocola sp.]
PKKQKKRPCASKTKVTLDRFRLSRQPLRSRVTSARSCYLTSICLPLFHFIWTLRSLSLPSFVCLLLPSAFSLTRDAYRLEWVSRLWNALSIKGSFDLSFGSSRLIFIVHPFSL